MRQARDRPEHRLREAGEMAKLPICACMTAQQHVHRGPSPAHRLGVADSVRMTLYAAAQALSTKLPPASLHPHGCQLCQKLKVEDWAKALQALRERLCSLCDTDNLPST